MLARRAVPLLLLLALMAAACGGGGGDDAGGGGGGGGAGGGQAPCPVEALDEVTSPVEIEVWHSMPAENGVTLERLTEAYHASQDKVRVKLVFQGGYDDAREKYLAALRGGKLPDLIQQEEVAMQLLIDSKSMLPAQACVDAADYDLSDHLERVVTGYSVDGTLWPMPFGVSSPVLYYDKAAFREAGLDPEQPPTTFEELQAAARAITDSGAAESGFAFAISASYVDQWFAKANEPIVDNANGRKGRATEALFANDLGTEILTFLGDMIHDGSGVSVGVNPGGFDNLFAIGNNKAAMTIETSAAIGSIIAVQEAGQFTDVELGVAALPGDDEGGVIVGGGAMWMVERSSDAEKAAAWDFVRYLNEPEQVADWSVSTGYIPTRESAIEDPLVVEKWEQYPVFRVAYDQVVAPGAPAAGPVIGAYDEFNAAIERAIEQVFLEDADPAAVLAEAERDATEAIQSYNDRVGG